VVGSFLISKQLYIRSVQPKDKKLINEISRRSFPEEEVEQIVLSLLGKQNFYVAEDIASKHILGFVVFSNYLYNTGHILVIAVSPQYQRMGIGSQLLFFALHHFEKKGIRKVRLEVRESNYTALKFYQYHHFRIISYLKNYYSNGDNAFVMLYQCKK
jgi:ribosomal-protein-alanine N-acetyltransferase